MPGRSRLRDNVTVADRVRELLGKYPDLRLCQLIGNAVPSEEAQRRNNDFYYVEDKQLLQWLEEYDQKIQEAAQVQAAQRPKLPGRAGV